MGTINEGRPSAWPSLDSLRVRHHRYRMQQSSAASPIPIVTVGRPNLAVSSALQEAAARKAETRAPPVMTVMPGGHKAASREAASQEVAASACGSSSGSGSEGGGGGGGAEGGGSPSSMSHVASPSSAVLETRLRGMAPGNPSSTLLSACSNPTPISTIPGDSLGSHAAAAPGQPLPHALSFGGFTPRNAGPRHCCWGGANGNEVVGTINEGGPLAHPSLDSLRVHHHRCGMQQSLAASPIPIVTVGRPNLALSSLTSSLTISGLGPDASADLFLNILLNVNHDTRKIMIIKLVSHSDIRRSIKEVLLTTPIVSQATINKSAVYWEECTPLYAVDQHAFWIHTRGKNKGLPRDSDPNIHTVGERMASFRAKKKVLKALVGIGTLEQRRLILLRVLSDPSIQNLSSSIGINMKETKLGQQFLQCARKLVGRTQNSFVNYKCRCQTSIVKRSVIKALRLGLVPTPTKEMSNNGIVHLSKKRYQ